MMVVALAALAVLLLIGVPIAFAVGIMSMGLMYGAGGVDFLMLVPQRMFAGVSIFTIMAIPFFFLAAELMTASGILDDLVEFADAVVGRLRGGLAHVNVLASAFFAGISGSAISDVAGLGAIEIRAMTAAGYDKRFATALTVASSLIGPIVPPSIIVLLYASIMQVSVAAMFLAALVPGLLLTAMLMTAVAVMAHRRNFPRREKRLSAREFAVISLRASAALFMPVIILGGILGGVFTATEAAAVAALYAFLIGVFLKRTLHLSAIPGVLLRSAVMTSVIFMVLATASIFGWVIGLERVPEALASSLIGVTQEPRLLLLLIVGLLIVVGMFMDVGAALIVMAPILAPTAVRAGVDPVHFGIVMSLTLVVGLNTPPVGPCLFAAASVSKLKIEEISVALLPFYALEVVFLLIVTFFPSLSMTLPRMLGYV